VGPADSEPRGTPEGHAFSYTDAQGRPTDDPAAAVSVELTEFDLHGQPRKRTRFFLDDDALPWLPVSEPAFLLWVLAALIVGWLVLGLILGLL
jgi:hypothetical protein